ncbi:hypothetical protein [Pseudomarimonas arenosa]|uniref:GGDEF domain-containing protein n=1 Tax=Pseudomarimonas arenosa TaxID=2774145 RepID=A0AAW3ZHM3_9GAMM|nr:hypothetical protein [Pseudomarimonas arenosa]MBD8525508.1 hypothetical protein [Pseudomarimonas arenosa]
MIVELFLGRTIELTFAGLANYVRDLFLYRSVSGPTRQQIEIVLREARLPSRFDGCIRAIFSFSLSDRCRIEEVLVRRPENDWIFLMSIDLTRESFADIGANSFPLVVGTLLRTALNLSSGMAVVRGVDVLRSATGQNRETDLFVSHARRDETDRGRGLEVVFDCSGGLGSTADLDLRHQIEQILDEALIDAGCGKVVGGSIGGGEMEVHVDASSVRLAKRTIVDTLKRNDLPLPKRIARVQ